jgi:hypothetical protein
MTNLTYGTYIIYDLVEPTSAWVVSDHTEGTDYVKLSSKHKLSHHVAFSPGVMDLPGGSAYAMNFGTFSEKLVLDEICTRAQYDLVLKFLKTVGQTAYTGYLYVVVVTSDTGPALMDWYQNVGTSSDVIPVSILALDGTWEEGGPHGQHWTIVITLQAVWG